MSQPNDDFLPTFVTQKVSKQEPFKLKRKLSSLRVRCGKFFPANTLLESAVANATKLKSIENFTSQSS